jgi:hypothetical protein
VQWHGDENEQGGCPLAAAGRTAARPSSPEAILGVLRTIQRRLTDSR